MSELRSKDGRFGEDGMIDRKKIAKGLECHRKKIQTTNAVSCLNCPYADPNPIREWCMSGLIDDIYTLLKWQEEKLSWYERMIAVEADTNIAGWR